MIGRAFRLCFPEVPTTFYCAGVSDSTCRDDRDFARERERLQANLDPERVLVYFDTCAAENSLYGWHKAAMCEIVRAQPMWMVLRLPTVAGRTPNPHTLFNYIHARVARGERLTVWSGARRHIVDVSDVVRVAEYLLNAGACNLTVDVAAPFQYSALAIVQAMETVTGKTAVLDMVERESVQKVEPLPEVAHIFGGVDYLQRTVDKYYG